MMGMLGEQVVDFVSDHELLHLKFPVHGEGFQLALKLINFNRKEIGLEHDRYNILIRTNGTNARIIIGKDLDFINHEGTMKQTNVIVEDPFSSRLRNRAWFFHRN